MANTKLTLDDITDLRAYERERDEFRRHVIALKKRRRVAVGPFVTFLFENRDTIRFQIQEMARVERLITDEAIEDELRVYNPLIPEPGQLSATLFVELTSKPDLERWLPALVGIERAVELRLGAEVVPAVPEEAHEAQLTRPETTASVHYVRFELTPAQVTAFSGPVQLAVTHPAYEYAADLSAEAVEELAGDLKGT